jgi:hypothetical protein
MAAEKLVRLDYHICGKKKSDIVSLPSQDVFASPKSILVLGM